MISPSSKFYAALLFSLIIHLIILSLFSVAPKKSSKQSDKKVSTPYLNLSLSFPTSSVSKASTPVNEVQFEKPPSTKVQDSTEFANSTVRARNTQPNDSDQMPLKAVLQPKPVDKSIKDKSSMERWLSEIKSLNNATQEKSNEVQLNIVHGDLDAQETSSINDRVDEITNVFDPRKANQLQGTNFREEKAVPSNATVREEKALYSTVRVGDRCFRIDTTNSEFGEIWSLPSKCAGVKSESQYAIEKLENDIRLRLEHLN